MSTTRWGKSRDGAVLNAAKRPYSRGFSIYRRLNYVPEFLMLVKQEYRHIRWMFSDPLSESEGESAHAV